MNEDRPIPPELLAAYFDGELEGRADLRKDIEAWLAENAQVQEDLAGYRALADAWVETAPPEPAAPAWDKMLLRLQPVAVANRRLLLLNWAAPWLSFAGVAAAILFAAWPRAVVPEPTPSPVVQASAEAEILEVAQASEITIIRVEGADTQTVVVGELPLGGHIELLAPGDVTLTSIQPHGADNMVPEVRLNQNSPPLIWARTDTEDIEP